MENVSERALLIAQEIAKRTATGHYRLVLNEEREPTMTGSKIGGKPYWPAGMDYPTDERGEKMLLLMQVNCEEAGLKAPLPEQGMLQWFISLNPERMYGCQGNYNEDGTGCRIIYHQSIKESATPAGTPTHDTVDDMLTPVKREVAIDVVPEETVMGVNDGHFNSLFFDIVKDITGAEHPGKAWYQYLDNNDCLHCERNLGMKRPCHQMTGYPVYTQGEIRSDLERHDVLLFQLDSQFSSIQGHGELVMWGDMGSGYIFINHDDLAARDFSRLYYCWDCG